MPNRRNGNKATEAEPVGPGEEGLLVHFLCALRGYSQKEMARLSGVSKSTISANQSGQQLPSRRNLARMAAAVKLPFPWLEPIRALLARLRAGRHPWPATGQPGEDPAAAVTSAIEIAVQAEAAKLAELAEDSGPAEAPTERDGAEAEILLAHLQPLSPRERRVLVDGALGYRTEALLRRLCAASEKAAASDPAEAQELAKLALYIATKLPGSEADRCRRESLSTGLLANALRVQNDHAGAERAFARVWKLWRAGAPSQEQRPDEARLLDLEASLRRDQRRFADALRLHDRALAVNGADGSGYILLNRAGTLEQSGAFERAIETLREAAPRVDAQKEPRLACVLRFNLAVNLCHLERHLEAEDLLPAIRALAEGLGNDLDLLRGRWLEGRVAAGLGRREEAAETLAAVRAEFKKRQLPYDAALAALDLAALRLDQGRTAEVKELAREMVGTFVEKEIHREAERAVQLFRDAAEREAATVALVRRLTRFLQRAQNDPRLRFEAA
jgi:transcriptional regulator with XRE-family HTH domain